MYELFDLKEAIRFGDCSQLLYVSPFKFERDWNGMRHSHECTEIFFCIGGKGSFAIEKEVFSVSPYDCLLYTSVFKILLYIRNRAAAM